MRTIVVSCLMLAAGCAAGSGGLSREAILSQAPVVNTAEGAEEQQPFPRGLSEEDARLRLDSARDAFLTGDLDECLRIVRAALEEGPPNEVAEELRELRYEASRRLVSRKVLRVKALPVRDVVTMGETAVVELLFRNVAPVEVRIPRSIAGSSETSFFLEITRSDYDVFGNVRSETERELVPVTEDLVLPPGATRSLPFSGPLPNREAGTSVSPS